MEGAKRMKKRIFIFCGVVLILLFGVFAIPKYLKPELAPTGTYREGFEYGGQDCIMYNDLLYWEQSIYEDPPLGSMELVGTVKQAVDRIPEQNFDSAVTAEGSELYYTDNNPGIIVVKENGIYYIFSLQDNS